MQRICTPILAWYGKNRRDLEWRRDPLPYYVWVSEIMLQQTRVEAVKPYFSRFIRELPDIRHLAQCSEGRLLKLWEGLGYYSRARNLQKTAGIILEQYNGELPSDVHILKTLPGIGSYTAGAISSIAFGLPEPAVDGNVLRVISRITALKESIDEPKVRKAVEDRIRAFLAAEKDSVPPGAFNQALMELGAMVCLPGGEPLCGECPVRGTCEAGKTGQTGSIPVRKRKKPRRIEERTVLVIRDASRALIRRRQGRGLLAGLWELPNVSGHLTLEEALSESQRFGISPVRIRPLPDAKHIFTHVEWHMKGYLILAEEMEDDAIQTADNACERDPGLTDPPLLSVEIGKIAEEYSIPTAFAPYIACLNIRQGRP